MPGLDSRLRLALDDVGEEVELRTGIYSLLSSAIRFLIARFAMNNLISLLHTSFLISTFLDLMSGRFILVSMLPLMAQPLRFTEEMACGVQTLDDDNLRPTWPARIHFDK